MDDERPQFELTEPDFLELLVKHEPALRAYARGLVPDWDLVDEALQEASVTMWQKRGQLESADGFVPWARVVLRYKCLRQLEILRSRRPLLE
jgi:RNA polymerase sigma-70 factor (ECF subfamily)